MSSTFSAPTPNPAAWPVDGGACGTLIRAFDWSRTSLGAIADWSPALRTTVSNIVNSPVPKVLMWGADHVMIYNDGYAAIAGDRHPQAMGMDVASVWPDLWDWNRTILDRGFDGEVVAFHDQPMMLARGNDGAEQRFFLDLFYTPVHLDDGSVGGVMCTVIDNTARVGAEIAVAAGAAELRAITDALPVLISYVGVDHVYRFANSYYLDWFGLTPNRSPAAISATCWGRRSMPNACR
ncbi:hypothetical protein [Sphingomonas insulae]|uniref:hypothetical protein n=1 Tax=Sphingomonas insulae TaxID=424800 RepID=UPI002010E159|nr:hypothetical protein [Sphingomonas insulae]